MQPIQLPVTQVGLEQSIQAAMRKAGGSAQINLGTNSRQINALSQPLGRITGQADEFTKSMAAANARVLAFGASAGIMAGVSKALAGIVTSTIKVEKSLANINVVLNKNGAELEKFGNQLFDVAKQTGQTFDQVAEAATELARQGLSATDTLSRLNDSLILSRLSGLDAAKSVEGLTAAYNSFASTGVTTSQILNKLVVVAQKYAVSEKDLIEGLKRSSAVANQAGVSLDELVGIITAVQEKTARGGAVIGNSFKTIFSRIQDRQVLSDLDNIGVKVVDLQGKVLPATAILQNLATSFKSFSQLEQADISEKLGGIYQLSNLLAALEDLGSETSKYKTAVQDSAKATTEAYSKNAALNQTLDALINKVTVSAEQLGATLGKIGVTDSLKNILSFFNGLLEGIQKILGEESGLGDLFRGIAKGIGAFAAGPGLALFGAIILKLSKDLVQFGFASLKSFFGIGKAAKEVQNVEMSIQQILTRNVDLQQKLFALEGNRAGQLRLITDALIQQEALLRRTTSTASSLGTALYNVGGRATPSGLRINPPTAAGGYVPAVAKESSDIRKGVGGARGGDKPVVIPNFNFGSGKRGSIVAHTGEYVVPNFQGKGSAVFNRDMVKSMGLPSGARKIGAAGGFVPNFADKAPKGPGSLEALNALGRLGIYPSSLEDLENTEKYGRYVSVSIGKGGAKSYVFNGKALGLGNDNFKVYESNLIKPFGTKSKNENQTIDAAKIFGSNLPPILTPNQEGLSQEFTPYFGNKRIKWQFPAYKLNVAGKENVINKFQKSFGEDSIKKFALKQAQKYAQSVVGLLDRDDPIQPDKIADFENARVQGFLSSVTGAFGGIFDAAVTVGVSAAAKESSAPAKNIKGNFDVNMSKGSKSYEYIKTLFGGKEMGSIPRFDSRGQKIADRSSIRIADFKINAGKTSTESMAGKVMKVPYFEKALEKEARTPNAAGGYIPNFASMRSVGYLDGDVLEQAIKKENERIEKDIEKGLIKKDDFKKGIIPDNYPITKTFQKFDIKGGAAGYHKFLGSLVSKARAENKIKKFTSVFGVPGAGKSTMMLGGGKRAIADNATFRKTDRRPILTPEDIYKVSEIVDTRASVGSGTIDAIQGGYLSNVDKMTILSTSTKEEQLEVLNRRKDRDEKITKGVSDVAFGRSAGTSTGAPVDSAYIEALALSILGPDKVRVMGIQSGFKLKRKKGSELPMVEEKRLALAWGAFALPTRGHKELQNMATSMGIPVENLIVAVSKEGGRVDPKDTHSWRTAIFDQGFRKLLTKKNFPGANVIGADPNLFQGGVPTMFEVDPINNQRRFLKAGAGSVALVGSDKTEKDLEKYIKAGYQAIVGERTEGISGTSGRQAMMDLNNEAIAKIFTKDVMAVITEYLPQIKSRGDIFPEILNRASNKVDKKLLPVEAALAQLPSRITPKVDPAIAEQILALRDTRDKMKRLKERYPSIMLRKLGKLFPSKYGLPSAAGGFIPNFADKVSAKSGSDVSLENGILKVGFLLSSRGNPLFEILRLLDQGKIKEIDAGAVIGPKIPDIIVGMKKIMERKRLKDPSIPRIPIRGFFRPAALSSKISERSEYKFKNRPEGIGRYDRKGIDYYGTKDQQNFISALREMGVDRKSDSFAHLERIYPNGLAGGYIPNFAKDLELLGRGAYGNFYKITDKIGVKKFNEPSASYLTSKSDLKYEYAMGKLLSENSFIPSVTAPKILSTLQTALTKNKIRKQIIPDPVADKSIGRQFGRRVGRSMEHLFEKKGITATDLHGENFTLNGNSKSFVEKFISQGEPTGKKYLDLQNLRFNETFFNDMNSKGGRINIIDTGYMEPSTPELKQKISGYLEAGSPSTNKQKSAAGGYIPNFANPLTDFLGGAKFIGSAANAFRKTLPKDSLKTAIKQKNFEPIFGPLLKFFQNPSALIKSNKDLENAKRAIRLTLKSDLIREAFAKRVAPLVSAQNYNASEVFNKNIGTFSEFEKNTEAYAKYKLFGGTKNLSQYAPEGIEGLVEKGRFLKITDPKYIQKLADAAAGVGFGGHKTKKIDKKGNYYSENYLLGGYTGRVKEIGGKKYASYEDRWDVDLHGSEKKFLRERLNKTSSENIEYFKNFERQYDQYDPLGQPDQADDLDSELGVNTYDANDVNSFILRELVSAIPKAKPVVFKGVVPIASKGYLPNFANPLQAAVGREMAAGVPASQIYIDKSPSLKNAANPMGLMVANRRDEPAGGFQGINRAMKEGRNPQTYGAASGFIPNFAISLTQMKELRKMGPVVNRKNKDSYQYNHDRTIDIGRGEAPKEFKSEFLKFFIYLHELGHHLDNERYEKSFDRRVDKRVRSKIWSKKPNLLSRTTVLINEKRANLLAIQAMRKVGISKSDIQRYISFTKEAYKFGYMGRDLFVKPEEREFYDEKPYGKGEAVSLLKKPTDIAPEKLKVFEALRKKVQRISNYSLKNVAGGFLPNFANPLQEAVGREMAAGVPASQIYIDKSPALKNAANPMGLMVANRRDEPAGGFQGINRAVREGRDPKMYGAAGGFVPNYAPIPAMPTMGSTRAPFDQALAKFAKELEDGSKTIEEVIDELAKIKPKATKLTADAQNLAKKYAEELAVRQEAIATRILESKGGKKLAGKLDKVYSEYNKSEKTAKDLANAQAKATAILQKTSLTPKTQQAILSSTQSLAANRSSAQVGAAGNRDMLGTIFAVQGAFSALTGATEDATGAFGSAVNAFSSAAGTATTTLFATQGLSQAFGGAEKGVGKFLAKLGPYAAAAGFLYTGIKEFAKYIDTTNPEVIKASEAMSRVSDAASKAAINLNNINPATKTRFEKESATSLKQIGLLSEKSNTIPKTYKQRLLRSARSSTGRMTDLTQGLGDTLESNVLSTMSQARGVGVSSSSIDKILLKYAKEGDLNYAGETQITPVEAEKAINEIRDLVTKIANKASAEGAFSDLSEDSKKQLGNITPQQLDEVLKNTQNIADARKSGDSSKLKELMNLPGAKELTEARDTLYGAGVEDYLTLDEYIRKVYDLAQEKLKEEEKTRKETEKTFKINMAMFAAEANFEERLNKIKDDVAEKEIKRKEEVERIENDRNMSELERQKKLNQTNNKYDAEIDRLNKQSEIITNINNTLKESLGKASPQFDADFIADVLPKLTDSLSVLDPKDKNFQENIQSELKKVGLEGIDSTLFRELATSLRSTLLTNKSITSEVQRQENATKRTTKITNDGLDVKQTQLSLEKEITSQIESRNSQASFAIENRVLNNAYESLSVNREIERVKRDTALNELEKAEEVYELELKRRKLESTGIGISLEQKLLNLDQELINKARAAIKGSDMIKGPLDANLTIEELQNIAKVDKGVLSEINVAKDQAKSQAELARKDADNQKANLSDIVPEVVIDKVKAGFSGGIGSGVINLQNQINTFAFDIGEKIPQMFSDNMSNAINKMIEGGESFGNILQGAAYEFVKGINQANIKNLSDKFSNFLFGSDEATGKSNIMSMFGFASGGKVTGGSGSKDDVPAMLMGGEYVINKNAVRKYGPQFFDSINKGQLSGFAEGGKVPKQRGPQGNFYTPGTYDTGAIEGKRNLLDFATQSGTSGQFDRIVNMQGYQSISLEPESSRLTVAGMRNSPAFEATQSAKQQAFDLYLQQYQQEKEAKRAEKEQKKAFRNQLIMMAGTAALGGIVKAAMAGGKAAVGNLAKDANFLQKAGTFTKGMFTGGTIDGQNVGGLKNLFSGIGSMATGNFKGGMNQIKLSQIGTAEQYLKAIENPKFAGYLGVAPRASIVTPAQGIVFDAAKSMSGGILLPEGLANPNMMPIGAETPSISNESTRFGFGWINRFVQTNSNSDLSRVGPFDKDGNYVEELADRDYRRATGGMIPSTSGIDTVPAMLSGGEFIMNRAAVQNIGAGNLQSMNSGTQSVLTDEASKEMNEKLLSKLDELIEVSSGGGDITINVSGSGNETTAGDNNQDASSVKQQLAREVKDAVLKVLDEQKRLGGRLRR
jgi:TP901 family phage tail tape measure protein